MGGSRTGARQNGAITKLILINGPPAVGKSALARRYVDDHPLALHLEIDAIRVCLGRWAEFDESKLIARSLATAMAEAHLRSGRDVIVAQYLGRTGFIEALDQLAQQIGADFRELVLMDHEAAVADRFRARRVELSAASRPHPQHDVNEQSVDQVIAGAFQRLKAVATERTRTQVITAAGGVEQAYAALGRVLDDNTRSSR